jgi:hypothetical protein
MELRTEILMPKEVADDCTLPFEILSIEWGARKIPTSHGRHVTGMYPIGLNHDSVPFESKLERDFVALAASCRGFRSIVAQPVTVTARLYGALIEYTPDYLVTIDPLPPRLHRMGFELRTLVEVKPAKFVDQEKLATKFAMLLQAVNLPCALMRESEIRGGGHHD